MVSQAHLDAFDRSDRCTQDGKMRCKKGKECNGRCIPKGHKCGGLKSSKTEANQEKMKRNLTGAAIGAGVAALTVGGVAAASHFSRKASGNTPATPQASPEPSSKRPSTGGSTGGASEEASLSAEDVSSEKGKRARITASPRARKSLNRGSGSTGGASEEASLSAEEASSEKGKRARITASPRARKSLSLEEKGTRQTQSKRISTMVGKLKENAAARQGETTILPKLPTRSTSEAAIQAEAARNRGEAGKLAIAPGGAPSPDKRTVAVMSKPSTPDEKSGSSSKQIVVVSKKQPLTQSIGPALQAEADKVVITAKKTAKAVKSGYEEGPSTDVFKRAGKSLGGFIGEQLKKSKIAIRRKNS